MGKTPVEVPGNKEPLVFRIDMGQPAGRWHCPDSATYPIKISPNPTRGARGALWAHACSVHTRVNASSPFAPTPPSLPQRKSAPTALNSANHPANISRSHECERCTHECVRHDGMPT
jgi:hypothetical protein